MEDDKQSDKEQDLKRSFCLLIKEFWKYFMKIKVGEDRRAFMQLSGTKLLRSEG